MTTKRDSRGRKTYQSQVKAVRQFKRNVGTLPKDPNAGLDITPPGCLSVDAAAFWQRNAGSLAERGALLQSDLDSFRILAECFADVLAFQNQRRELMAEDTVSAAEMARVNRQLRGASELYLQFMGQFGLSPKSRAKLPPSDFEPLDEFDKI